VGQGSGGVRWVDRRDEERAGASRSPQSGIGDGERWEGRIPRRVHGVPEALEESHTDHEGEDGEVGEAREVAEEGAGGAKREDGAEHRVDQAEGGEEPRLVVGNSEPRVLGPEEGHRGPDREQARRPESERLEGLHARPPAGTRST